MILLGVTLTCANGAISVGAVACFLLALLEAAAGAAAGVAKRVVLCGAALALAAVTALVLATSLGFLQPAADFGRSARRRDPGGGGDLWRAAGGVERADGGDARPRGPPGSKPPFVN